jgi:ketosteroid isomerase-like protein
MSIRCWPWPILSSNGVPHLARQWGATTYHGYDGFREYWRGTQDIWDYFHFEPEHFTDDGNSIVVVGRGSGRARGSGVEIDQPFAMLWKVRGRKAVFGETFTDPDEALAAAERLAQERE